MSRAHIILIEDNPADVFLVRKALEANHIDCDLTHFEDGDRALSMLVGKEVVGNPPDLILLDLTLRRSEGLDVLLVVRNEPRLAHVPVAILTSSASPSDRRRAFEIGAVGFISKPSQLDDFLAEVGGAIYSLLEHRAPGAK